MHQASSTYLKFYFLLAHFQIAKLNIKFFVFSEPTMECENLKGLQYLSSSGLPKTFLKIILATYLTSETSTALACTGLVVKSIAGIFRYQKKYNFPKKLQML